MTKFYTGKTFFSFLLIVLLHSFSTAQITTVAGRRFYLGDNGPATSAGLFNPYGIGIDASGNIYIATTRDNRVRKVDASTQTITTVAGTGVAAYLGDGGLATAAQLNLNVGLPGVTADNSGNIYISDYFNNRIRKIDAATKIVTTIAGTGTGGYSGDGGPATSAKINGPAGILLDAAGNIFFTDNNNSVVRRIDVTTKIITTVAGNGVGSYGGDGGLATAASLSYPECIALDATGNLYIADEYNNVIRKVDASTKIITTVAGNGGHGYAGDGGQATAASLGYVVGVAVDANGNIYIADQTNNRIRKVTNATKIITTIAGNGAAGFSGDGGAASAAQVNRPTYLQVDVAGNLYINDLGNNRVRKITAATNNINTIAGDGTDGFTGAPDASKAQLLPQAVTMDALGNLYIADGLYYDVRAVNVANSSYAFAGSPNPDYKYASKGYGGNGNIANSALYNAPYGVVVDASNNVYIADVFNNVIRKVNYSTKFITNIAGNATAGFSGDAGAATSAQLNNPYGLAIDKNGNIYIADALNNRIRKVAAATQIITTIAGTGAAGNTGDGAAATAAQISNPRGVAVDVTGNVFILDKGNNVIRMVAAATQKISTVLNNGHSLTGVATDASGNVFVSDSTAGTVIKLAATTYTASVVAGNGTPGYADNATSAALGQLSYPGGLYVSGTSVYVADINNNVIRKFTPATTITLTPIANNTISTVDSITTCTGKIILSTLTGTLPTAGTGTYAYSWLQSPDGVTYTAISGASLQNYAVGAAITQTTYYRRLVTSGSYSDTSNAVVFHVYTKPVPVISLKGTTTICKGLKDTLYTTVAYSKYAWSTGETTATIIDTVSRTNTLTVTDSNGCGGTSAAVAVTVNALPATPTITVSPANTTTLCPGTPVTLTSSTAANYKWSTSATTSSISVTAAGNYTVTITDVNGCTNTSAAKAIAYAAVTTPTITSSPATTTSLCPGTAVTLTSSTASKYKWSTAATTASISTSTAGSFTVTTTDANGCNTTSAAKVISYAVVTKPTITSSPAVTTNLCPHTVVTLSSSAAVTYKWSTTATTSSISTSSTGSYVVTTTDANGCTAVSAAKVLSYTTVTTPTITSSPTVTTKLCPGTAITFTSSSAAQYKWSTTATTASITTSTAGNYSVTTTDANGCTATSAAKTVSYGTCGAPLLVSSSGVTGTKATVKWHKVACAVNYSLQYAVNGSSSWTTVTATDTSYTLTGLTKSTTYQWQVSTVCVASPLTVSASSVSSKFTTTNASTLMEDATFGGTKSLQSASLQSTDWAVVLHPNPVVSSAMLDISGNPGKTALVITDMSGRKVWQAEVSGNKQVVIPSEKFAAGMYFITLSNEKSQKVIKLIKQ